MALLASYLVAAGVEVTPPVMLPMLLRPEGEELTLVMVLAQGLAVRCTCDSFNLLQVSVITEISGGKIILTAAGTIVALVKIRGVATRLAVAFRSSWSWPRLLAVHKGVEEAFMWWLWRAVMRSCVMALMGCGLATVCVDEAVPPVLVSLLCIVGPVVALSMVLADSLAVRGVGDMLYMLNQVLGVVTDHSLSHITRG